MDKAGIDLVIDRIEALRVRLDAALKDDALMVDFHDHWTSLCKEALAASLEIKRGWDLVTASMAMPVESEPAAVALAVRVCTRRCEELERKVADLGDRLLELRKSHL